MPVWTQVQIIHLGLWSPAEGAHTHTYIFTHTHTAAAAGFGLSISGPVSRYIHSAAHTRKINTPNTHILLTQQQYCNCFSCDRRGVSCWAEGVAENSVRRPNTMFQPQMGHISSPQSTNLALPSLHALHVKRDGWGERQKPVPSSIPHASFYRLPQLIIINYRDWFFHCGGEERKGEEERKKKDVMDYGNRKWELNPGLWGQKITERAPRNFLSIPLFFQRIGKCSAVGRSISSLTSAVISSATKTFKAGAGPLFLSKAVRMSPEDTWPATADGRLPRVLAVGRPTVSLSLEGAGCR